MTQLEEYAPIVGQSVIDELRLLGDRLKGKSVLNINSTAMGGGVAEILNRMMPLLKQLGVDARWEVIKGGAQFFAITKKIHNALHGKEEAISEAEYEIFRETTRQNLAELNLQAEIVFVHDPQPASLIQGRSGNKWVWRCHIDVSQPQAAVWDFLLEQVIKYDAAVFSAPSFSPPLPIPQYLISPSIDPLSDKNKKLPAEDIQAVLAKYGIDPERPVLTQISRFDRIKDPVGVIEVYRRVKRYFDCQLVLAGGGASDDPEGLEVMAEVKDQAQDDPDIHILLLPQNDLEINALQRGSTIILQKSLREGFGLTVAEALWKAKPVVASAVGGIPLQVIHQQSGLLCHSNDGAVTAVKQLLNNPDLAQKLGRNGHQHIKHNFLVTRHIRDYLMLFLSLYNQQDLVYL